MTTAEKVRTADRRAGKAARVRRAEIALIRTVGTVEAILLARDEETARRRASLALVTRDDDGHRVPPLALCEQVSAALGAWWRLRGAVAS